MNPSALCNSLLRKHVLKTEAPQVCRDLLFTHSHTLGELFNGQRLQVEFQCLNDVAFAGRKLPRLLLRIVSLHTVRPPDVSDPSHLDREVGSLLLTQHTSSSLSVGSPQA